MYLSRIIYFLGLFLEEREGNHEIKERGEDNSGNGSANSGLVALQYRAMDMPFHLFCISLFISKK